MKAAGVGQDLRGDMNEGEDAWEELSYRAGEEGQQQR